MDSRREIRCLKRGIEFFELEIEFARKRVTLFKEPYLDANKEFEEYSKGLSLDAGVTASRDTGECGENHFLLAAVEKLSAKRTELLAQTANLVAEGDRETTNYLQINIRFLDMLIKCERVKSADYKKIFTLIVDECNQVIYNLNDRMREVNVELAFKYDPRSPKGETLLAQRGKKPSSATVCEKRTSSPTESQKTIAQLQSKLAMLEIILEYEKCDTDKYEQLFLKVVDKFEETINKLKRRPSSCRCDPDVRPVRHRLECNVDCTRDDEHLLTELEHCLTETKSCRALIERDAGRKVAAVIGKVEQEVAKSIKHSDCNFLCAPSCLGQHRKKRQWRLDDRINYLHSKLNMLKVQLIYERALVENFGQLSLIVDVKFRQLLNEGKRRSLCADVTSGQDSFPGDDPPLADTEYQALVMESLALGMTTKLADMMMGRSKRKAAASTEVGRGTAEREEVVLQTSSTPENRPLLAQTENLSVEENAPADTEDVTEGPVTSVDGREAETDAAGSPWQGRDSPSGWFSKAVPVGVAAAAAGVIVLTVGLRYFR
ncbi:hypothetical protein Q8A73_004154 [Channa argus]|nr:hypothetical protein Q8A73_004154 [Channa argus]